MQTLTDDLRRILKARFAALADGFAGRIEVDGTSYEVNRMEPDKSLRLQADELIVELPNSDGALGWGSTSVFSTNQRIRGFQWYGTSANEVQVFDGLIAQVQDHRDVRVVTLTCTDRFQLLIDQHFVASAPQGVDETDAVRTEDNGVYLNREVSYIVNDILDRVGWPSADRAITDTSMVLTEFILPDGTSYADPITNDLSTLTGYNAWATELGIFTFAPTPVSDLVEVDVEPVYTWRTGIDIISLDDSTDQDELITRVKTRGPLTTLKNAWSELWETKKISQPVGIWYDPSDTANIRVIDRATKKLFTLRQSDRQIVASVYLGGVIPHPLGISGDPADSTIYWVLNAPWIDTGTSTGNSVKKIRKSDNHLLASYAIPDGRWSAIKVSSSYMWLTNLDTDRFYKRDKSDASAIANYQHSYDGTNTFPQTGLGTAQTNPSGLMIDGTTLHLFWSNGGTTARFLLCDESAPATVTGVVKTSGTVLHGGEMDTATHTECWGDSDSLGLVAKFTLFEPTETTVSAEVVDTDLEDELGALAELENRVHDTHPGDAAHPYEIRRMTLDLSKIDSLSQASDIARFWLDKLGRRRQVQDFGAVGHPGVQKNDLVRLEDPVTGLFQNGVVDTYQSSMEADGTYLCTISLIRGGIANDEITEPNPPPSEGTAVDPSDLSSHLYGVAIAWTTGPYPGDNIGGIASLENPAGAVLISSTNMAGIVLTPGTYTYHYEWSGTLTSDYASGIGLMDHFVNPIPSSYWRDSPSVPPDGSHDGSFVITATTPTIHLTAAISMGAVDPFTIPPEHTITVTFWLDAA